jgi:hypothetical protein
MHRLGDVADGAIKLLRTKKGAMKDMMLDRMWNDQHERFSADLGRAADRLGARIGSSQSDSLPLVARALALVLAVSLASLSLGSTLA